MTITIERINMLIKDKIQNDIIQAMKMQPQPKEKISSLKLIKAAIERYEIDNRSAETQQLLTDAIICKILNKMKSQLLAAKDLYIKGGKTDRAEQEQFTIDIIDSYLPKSIELSNEDLEIKIKQIIDDLKSKNNDVKMSDVINAVKENAENEGFIFNGKVVSVQVRELL